MSPTLLRHCLIFCLISGILTCPQISFAQTYPQATQEDEQDSALQEGTNQDEAQAPQAERPQTLPDYSQEHYDDEQHEDDDVAPDAQQSGAEGVSAVNPTNPNSHTEERDPGLILKDGEDAQYDHAETPALTPAPYNSDPSYSQQQLQLAQMVHDRVQQKSARIEDREKQADQYYKNLTDSLGNRDALTGFSSTPSSDDDNAATMAIGEAQQKANREAQLQEDAESDDAHQARAAEFSPQAKIVGIIFMGLCCLGFGWCLRGIFSSDTPSKLVAEPVLQRVSQDQGAEPDTQFLPKHTRQSSDFWEGALGLVWSLFMLTYVLAQVVAGYMGLWHYTGIIGVFFATVLAFQLKFALPFTIGSFMTALKIWKWHWFFALLFVAPGLIVVIPMFIAQVGLIVLMTKKQPPGMG